MQTNEYNPKDRPTKGIAVDCGCYNNPGKAEYRGIDLETGKEIFSYKIPGLSTNNIAEFLACVHGLAYCKKNNINEKVYTDSMTAIAWVRNQDCNTKFDVKDKVQDKVICRAIDYLQDNGGIVYFWSNILWGETPADYGRKQTTKYTDNKYKFLKR